MTNEEMQRIIREEVRKPLVEALEKIAQLISQELDLPRYEPAVTATLTDVGRIARAALAKPKEGE